MTKHLKVEYNSIVLFDGEVDEVVWSDGAGGVNVTGKLKRQGGGGMPSFLEKLAATSRQKTEAIADDHRAEIQSDATVFAE